MSITTARISSAQLRSAFVARVQKNSDQKLMACYQCGKCSAGCPMAPHMDLLPNQIIRLAQLGMQERLLSSSAIWACVSCMTCNTRCPKDVHIAEVIESLRDMAMRSGRRHEHLSIGDVPAEVRAGLPPIAMISAMRKLTS